MLTMVAARFGRLPGLLLAQLMIAVIISMLDVRWIQSEMAKPGWNGLPDQDVVFYIGVVLRIILINTVLLPVANQAMRRWQAARPAQQPLA